jgi:hypothetical protein
MLYMAGVDQFPLKVLALAANHRPAPAASANHKADLLHIGKNDDAIGPRQGVCGNVLAAEHCLQHRSGILQSLFVL